MEFIVGIVIGCGLMAFLDARAHTRIVALEDKLDALIATFKSKI